VNIAVVCIRYVSDTGETGVFVEHLFVHGLTMPSVSHTVEC